MTYVRVSPPPPVDAPRRTGTVELMRPTRILFWALLAVMLTSGTAVAAPGDPYVVYTANSYTSGAVILRTDPVSGSLVEVSRNGSQGTLFRRPYDLAVERDGNLVVAD